MPAKSLSCFWLLLMVAPAAHAQTMWGPPGPRLGTADRYGRSPRSPRVPLDNHVTTATFIAKDADAKLGHGPIAVTRAPGDAAADMPQPVFEAAVVDQLAKRGYDTAVADGQSGQGGQIALVELFRTVISPQEDPPKAVSGEAMMGVSNRGPIMGLAVNIDLSKARKPVITTRLKVRIKDRATGAALWEGRASMETRQDDAKWNDTAIASNLADALFQGFGQPGQARIVTLDAP
ncbi:MAG: hypothetical protein ACKOXK_12125 [Chakrabartia sp.]